VARDDVYSLGGENNRCGELGSTRRATKNTRCGELGTSRQATKYTRWASDDIYSLGDRKHYLLLFYNLDITFLH